MVARPGVDPGGSLSARRAWIEMATQASSWRPVRVALRKESVDRNLFQHSGIRFSMPSLSARRAWIEILQSHALHRGKPVALRKESVDRNHDLNLDWIIKALSLSARRAWIEIMTGC